MVLRTNCESITLGKLDGYHGVIVEKYFWNKLGVDVYKVEIDNTGRRIAFLAEDLEEEP